MDAVKFGLGDVLNECGALIRGHFALVALSVLGITAIYMVFDLSNSASAGTVPNLVIGIVGQYHFVEALLADRLMPDRKRRYGAIFAASLLSGIAILLGFVLLVIPGILLLSGWSASTPFIVAEQNSGTQALAASWRATAGARWSLLLLFAVYTLLFGLAIGGASLIIIRSGVEGGILESIGLNIAASLMSVAGWVIGVAVYRLAKPSHALETVFA